MAHPREKHLHLRNGRVLGFVQDNERIVQRAAAHVSQRNDLDQVLFHVAFDLLVVHHLAKRVEQRPQIRIDLGLQVTRQETEALARLDRGSHQHDLADRLLTQRFDRCGHREIRLARTSRSNAKHHSVLANRLQIAGLAFGAWTNLPPGRADLDRRAIDCRRAAGHDRDRLHHLLWRQRSVPTERLLELLKDLGGLTDGRLVTLNVDQPVAGRDSDRYRVADFP